MGAVNRFHYVAESFPTRREVKADNHTMGLLGFEVLLL
jgi:hypothetical protein